MVPGVDMDYRDLLVKYMALVIQEEGISYLNHVEFPWGINPVKFTEQEMSLLRQIERETGGNFGH